METGVRVPAPLAIPKFCTLHPTECTPTTRAVMELTEERSDELKAVNKSVNAAIRPLKDGDTDIWSINVTIGDCEDFALTKRAQLIARGWPPGSLLIAVVRIKGQEGGHAVLIAITSEGDLMLDNLFANVMPWEDSPYTWIKRMSGHNPREWVGIL